jgi:hypothetical protein
MMEDCSRYDGNISFQDETCYVDCPCGERVWVSGSFEISRCPECGMGYRTEFRVWQYSAIGSEDAIQRHMRELDDLMGQMQESYRGWQQQLELVRRQKLERLEALG